MKIYAGFMDEAWLLALDGTVLSVLNHPSVDFEFDSVLYVLSEYGDESTKQLVASYKKSPADSTKAELLNIYDNTWCKVRVWENGRLITFRITSINDTNWYRTIVDFLMEHPSYKNSNVTVETDKHTGVRRVFWNEISYLDAISPDNETVLAITQIT